MGFRFGKSIKTTETTTVDVPEGEIHYTEISSSEETPAPPPIPPDNGNEADNPVGLNNKKRRGCLFYFFALLAFCFAVALYSFAWIPAIGFLIYFAIKKDLYGRKRRNIAASAAVCISSLIIYALLNSTAASPESIYADWGKDTFDVSETAEVKLTASPSGSDISSLDLSANDIAELNYENGRAIITFKEPGEAVLFFTANHDIDSNSVKISVTDKTAEEAEEEARLKAEEEARIKAEEEAKVKAEEEARIKAEEEAKAKAEEEARIKAEEEAKAQAEEAARIKAEQEAQAAEQVRIAEEQAAAQAAAQPQEASVWLSATGSKYHSIPDCGNMNPDKARQVSLSEAQSRGYEACKNCH